MVFFFSICLMLVVTSPSWAAIITIELGSPYDLNPSPYIVDIQQLRIEEHSQIDLFIQNIEDASRWKNWKLTVWIPQGSNPLTQLNTLDYKWGIQEVDIPNVLMDPDPGAIPIPGYSAYYADTEETKWYGYGTQPIGANWGRVDVGNPGWISFHFNVDVPPSSPVFLSVYDVCVPEPATIALLGLGGLAMLRKRR